jgi:hypothetical protein
MRCEVLSPSHPGSLVIIDVNPKMQPNLRPYAYERFEIWAICWDSAWAALKLFWVANSLGTPTRAKLVRL